MASIVTPAALDQPLDRPASAPPHSHEVLPRARAEVALRSAVGKRAFDILLAAALLIATLPLIMLVALAIKLDSRGPVFYRVRRIGCRGRPFLMLKFRKMFDDASGAPITIEQDPRLTRVGAILTKTRLDELPQLWDVVRGRMSIIGPRPEDPRFVALHRQHFDRILAVRPGITGITQLAFAHERRILAADDPVGDYVARILPQKITLDALYAERRTIGLDLAVLSWTVVALLMRREVAVDRRTARMTVRKRPAPSNARRNSAAAGTS